MEKISILICKVPKFATHGSADNQIITTDFVIAVSSYIPTYVILAHLAALALPASTQTEEEETNEGAKQWVGEETKIFSEITK